MARVRLWKFPSFLIVLASVVEKNFLLPDVSIHRSRSNLSLSFFLLLCWPSDRETTHLARVSCIRLASRWMRPTNLLSLFLSSFYLKDSGQLSSTSGWRAAELVRRPVCWVAVVRRASLEGGSTRTCSCTRQQQEKEGAAGRIDALLPPAPTFFRFTPLRAPSLLTWTWPLWPTYSCGRTLCLSLDVMKRLSRHCFLVLSHRPTCRWDN